MPTLATVDLAVFDDDRAYGHGPWAYHPERVERLSAARAGLRAVPGSESWSRLTVGDGLPSEAALAHDRVYLEALERNLAQGRGWLDADTYFCQGTRDAVWSAAAGSASLGAWLAAGSSRRGLALTRPPGHHATRSKAMGFCFLNNVAIAAYGALTNGASKVAIVDWDAHHGNGTEEIFDEDPRVLFVSLHRAGGYPSTGSGAHRGTGAGLGTTLNIELPAGSDSAAFAYAMRHRALPAIASFDADVLLVSSGFDAHVRDPLSDLALDSASFGAMAGALKKKLGLEVTSDKADGRGRVYKLPAA